MAQFNHNLSLYIPVVQKWQANLEYFKNAFRSSFVGNVVRVDFVARNGGDPAFASELSAYVYLEWFYNEFSTNWQKVIFAKDPQMPAHFYHTVGRNYWILCENMKPRTLEQVAEEKKVALAKQGITIIDEHANNAKLLEELSKNLTQQIKDLTIENNEVKAHNATLEAKLNQTKFDLGTKIMGLNEELGTCEGQRIKEVYLRNDLYKNLDAGRTQILKLQTELADTKKGLGDTINELNIYKRDLPRQMAKIRDLSEEITELEAELETEKKAHEAEKKVLEIEKATLKSQKVSLEEELDDTIEDLTRMNQSKQVESLQARLTCSLSLCALKFKDLEKASAKIQELEDELRNSQAKSDSSPQIQLKNTIIDLNEKVGVREGERIEKVGIRGGERIKEVYLCSEFNKNLGTGRTQILKHEDKLSSASRINTETNTRFDCIACSTKVSFTSGKETTADKKHLCHTCFDKIGGFGCWVA
jgi:hypothetical protein